MSNSDYRPLDESELNLLEITREAYSNPNLGTSSSFLIQLNPDRSASDTSPSQSSHSESFGKEKGATTSDNSIDSPKTDEDSSPGSTTSTNANKKPGRRPAKGKPSSAIIQAKLNAQAQARKGNAGDEISFVIKDHLQPARDSKEVKRKDTAVIYDMKMVEHRSPWDPTHPECPERFSSIIKRCESLGLLERCVYVPPRTAKEQEILTLHSKEQIEKLREMSANYLNDVDKLEEEASKYDSIYFHPTTYDLALLACGSTIDLVNTVVSGKVQNGMAIIRPPGHHAMKAEFCGYCYFNNVAIAANSALASGAAKKILIVDFDVHHGQATQQMFYNDPRVLYFSTHRYEHGMFWPNLEESNYHWIGADEGLGFNCNIPLNKIGMGNSEFLSIWHHILMPMAYQFNPDLVIVSAGYDACLGCPEGQMEVTPQCYPHLITPLMGLANGKVAVILEGGYCIKSLSEAASLTLKTLLGDPCPIIPPISTPVDAITETILNSKYMLRKHWDFGVHESEESPQSDESSFDRLHVPSVKFEWKEPKPDKYPTRNCYPNVDPDVVAALDVRLDKLILTTSLAKAPHRVGFVYDDIMLKHRNTLDPGHPERPERISNIFACHGDFGLVERCLRIESRKATEEELALIHTEKHILRMKNTQKFGAKDLSNLQNKFNSIFLNNSSYECALHSAGAVLQVVDKVLNGECQSGVAVVRPPGHHAEVDEPCGFCLFNNVALAAKYALDAHGLKRILVLDWDVHHGNGIQRIFESDPRVLYISLHRYDFATFFPCSPDADYTVVGTGKGEGFNVNIPWNRSGLGDTEYLYAFNNVILPIAYEFAPELVLVSAGFDAARGDPLGGLKVSPEGYAHMTHLLSPLANGKVILALEGGYNLTSIAYSMTLCTKALLGDPIPSLTLNPQVDPSARNSISNVLNTHAKYWKTLNQFQKTLPEDDGIVLPAKYDREEDLLTKQLKNLGLSPGQGPNSVEDNTNANANTDPIIPDPPPASGEPSSSFPSPLPPPTAIIRRPAAQVQAQISQASIGGGENTPVVPEPEQPNEDEEALEGAVGGMTVLFPQSLQDAQTAMIAESATPRDIRTYLVAPLSWCLHMEIVNPVPQGGLNWREACQECQGTVENWICLTCYSVFCGRYVQQHMVRHSDETGHPIALSFADLSVWCYGCDSYLDSDSETIRPAKRAAHLSKFGVDLPGPASTNSTSPHS